MVNSPALVLGYASKLSCMTQTYTPALRAYGNSHPSTFRPSKVWWMIQSTEEGYYLFISLAVTDVAVTYAICSIAAAYRPALRRSCR